MGRGAPKHTHAGQLAAEAHGKAGLADFAGSVRRTAQTCVNKIGSSSKSFCTWLLRAVLVICVTGVGPKSIGSSLPMGEVS